MSALLPLGNADPHNQGRPKLTVAIPTFNRANYLELTLRQFLPDVDLIAADALEILVSDNCSADHTPEVIAELEKSGLRLRYIRNNENIGSDANIAQCFNEARGQYVQIMGDDDLYLPGKLREVMQLLQTNDYGVVCVKAYGYEDDFLKERPTGSGGIQNFDSSADFLYEVGPLITFISSCVINKDLQSEVDARSFCGSNLVQVHLVILPMLRAQRNIYLLDYTLACKRANSGGYDFTEIFVEKLFGILRTYQTAGLPADAIARLGRKMLLSYYPFNLVRQRMARLGSRQLTFTRFHQQFGWQWRFVFFCLPIIVCPRPVALAWGSVAVLIGRSRNGELRRGWHFAVHRLTRILRRN